MEAGEYNGIIEAVTDDMAWEFAKIIYEAFTDNAKNNIIKKGFCQ